MSFGRPYIMRIPGAIHDGWLHLRIKDREAVDQDYLYEVLRSEVVKSQYEKLATGGVVRNLNSKLVSGVKIPLPPIDIQRKIVQEIETYSKEIIEMKNSISKKEMQIRNKITAIWGVKEETLLMAAEPQTEYNK